MDKNQDNTMKTTLTLLWLFYFPISIFGQPLFTANDTVPDYDTPFRLSINPNFNGNQWSDQSLSDIAAGNPNFGKTKIPINKIKVNCNKLTNKNKNAL